MPCRGPVTIVTCASKGKERGATFLVGLLRKAAICVCLNRLVPFHFEGIEFTERVALNYVS